ncbi:release factor H-coupled R [Crassisporium funariophilum]|nr:release factor H-coupled R [Crassisporium funariophilum]
MPSRALTVTLNFDHNRKFVSLLPEAAESRKNLKERILREARNKFCTKGLSSVFLLGGISLADEEDFPEAVEQVWIGKGEPYTGPPKQSAFDGGSCRAEDVRVIGVKSFIDDNAIKQLQNVGKLPGVRLAIGMPDLHPGNRFPIGCAIASDGIYPALIGSDVGCGIALYRLSSRGKLNPKKLASLLQGLDEPWSGSVSGWLARYGIERSSQYDHDSLGTVGSGNHFAEICTPERIIDASVASSLDIDENSLYLLVHTGSRGLGASILANETVTEANPYISPDSQHLSKYLAEHDYAVKWAVANRDLVAHRIKKCISQTPRLEGNQSSGDDQGQPIELGKIIDVTHNSVTRKSLLVEGETRDLWVHRKGAAPADQGVVPCPGSRGDFSWLLQPIGDGQHNACSLAHGAGRRYGRQVLHAGSKINKSSLTTTSLGSEVVCMDPDLLIEERPEAYKDVQCVVEDMEDQNMCRGVVKLRPIVTYKVREGIRARK